MASFCVTLFDTLENPADDDACFLCATRNLTLSKGSSYRIKFLLSKDGEDVNLTGYALRGHIKKSSSSTEVLLDMTSANQLLKIDNSTSSILMFIPESFTRRVVQSFAIYEIELLSPISETSRIVQGLITFI